MIRSTRQILNRLARRGGLLLLLATTLTGAITGAVYGMLATPTYRAQAYVVAIGDPGESITALNFAQAYGRIAARSPITDRAGAILGTGRGVRGVTASTSPDAPVIEITATGATPKRTAEVANAVAAALVEYGIARKTDTRVTLAVLAPATVPRAPASPKPPLELVVGAAGGLLVGSLAVLAGVGRSSGRTRRPDAAADRYDVAELDERQPAPSGIGPFSEAAAPDNDRRAITSYSAEAAPNYLETAAGDVPAATQYVERVADPPPGDAPTSAPETEPAVLPRAIGRASVNWEQR